MLCYNKSEISEQKRIKQKMKHKITNIVSICIVNKECFINQYTEITFHLKYYET